jgi:hypothetical protein
MQFSIGFEDSARDITFVFLDFQSHQLQVNKEILQKAKKEGLSEER